MSNVRIADDGSGHGVIEVDGHKLARAIRGATVAIQAGRRTQVTLDLALLHGTDIDSGNAQVILTDEVRAALVALGWTPPAGTP